MIDTTFSSFNPNSSLPAKLVPDLLHRFGSAEGYRLFEDVASTFEALRRIKQLSKEDPTYPILVVGVISNSDDSVPTVLSDLGLNVSPRRHGLAANGLQLQPEALDDIDFIIMSYDVGHEKPSLEIFDAAKQLVQSVWGNPENGTRFVHVGDDLEKDCQGAMRAEWESVLLDREGTYEGQGTLKTRNRITNLRKLIAYLHST